MGKGARNRARRAQVLREMPKEMQMAIHKAASREIKRHAVEWANDFDLGQLASISLILYNEFKFGPMRIKHFCECFMMAYAEFRQEYLMDNPEDYEWYAVRMLKDKTGLDLREWMDDWDRRVANGELPESDGPSGAGTGSD